MKDIDTDTLKTIISCLVATPPSKIFEGHSKTPFTVEATPLSFSWSSAVICLGCSYPNPSPPKGKPTSQTRLGANPWSKVLVQPKSPPKTSRSTGKAASPALKPSPPKTPDGSTPSPAKVTFSPAPAPAPAPAPSTATSSPAPAPPGTVVTSSSTQSPASTLTGTGSSNPSRASRQQTLHEQLPALNLSYSNTIRVQMVFPGNPDDSGSPNPHFIGLLRKFLEVLQAEDPGVFIANWKETDTMEKEWTKPQGQYGIPNDISSIRKHKLGNLGTVRKDKDNWFKIRLGLSKDTSRDLPLSLQESSIDWWFTENKVKSYLVTIQETFDSVPLGLLMFTGPFINPYRVTREIKAYAQNHRLAKNHQFIIGAKTRKLPAKHHVQEPSTDWTMSPNQPIQIECARSHSKALKQILNDGFNHQGSDPIDRIGMYFANLIPDKDLIRTGSKGADKIRNCYRKHTAVVLKLAAIRVYTIAELDEDVQVSKDLSLSLRKALLTIPWPCNHPDSSERLFFSVDFASKGRDLEAGATIITAYQDRLTDAESLAEILPAYMYHLLSPVTKRWFHADAHEVIHDVTFTYDEEGNWTGEWSTSDDDNLQTILDEDLGCGVTIEGLSIVDEDQDAHRPAIPYADDQSKLSFNTIFGGNSATSDENPQGTNLATEEGSGPSSDPDSPAGASNGGSGSSV